MPKSRLTGWLPQFDSAGNLKEIYGWDVILKSVFMILCTPVGTRQWQPDFGSKIETFLFGTGVEASEIENEVRRCLSKWEPRAMYGRIKCEFSNLPNKRGIAAIVYLQIFYEDEQRRMKFIVPTRLNAHKSTIYNYEAKDLDANADDPEIYKYMTQEADLIQSNRTE